MYVLAVVTYDRGLKDKREQKLHMLLYMQEPRPLLNPATRLRCHTY